MKSIKSTTSREVGNFIANYYENLVTDLKSNSCRDLSNFATHYLNDLIDKVKVDSMQNITQIGEDKKSEIVHIFYFKFHFFV